MSPGSTQHHHVYSEKNGAASDQASGSRSTETATQVELHQGAISKIQLQKAQHDNAMTSANTLPGKKGEMF